MDQEIMKEVEENVSKDPTIKYSEFTLFKL